MLILLYKIQDALLLARMKNNLEDNIKELLEMSKKLREANQDLRKKNKKLKSENIKLKKAQ